MNGRATWPLCGEALSGAEACPTADRQQRNPRVRECVTGADERRARFDFHSVKEQNGRVCARVTCA